MTVRCTGIGGPDTSFCAAVFLPTTDEGFDWKLPPDYPTPLVPRDNPMSSTTEIGELLRSDPKYQELTRIAFPNDKNPCWSFLPAP